MNDFNQRWQTLARQADGLFDEELPELPFGFAARIMARRRDSASESWEDLVSVLGMRAILATAVVCIATAGLAFSNWYEFRIERPVVERTFTSDLSWP